MQTRLFTPRELAEALELLAAGPPRPVLLAGGTDLWPHWTSDPAGKPEAVLSLHRLAALRGVSIAEEGMLRIGACCTHTDLVRSDLVRQGSPALAEAAATVGALQIQNRGTVGGNLANGSPAADLPPPLAAAGALVELSSARGTRRLPLRQLYKGYRSLDMGPDELITAVLVPRLPAGAREHFRKVGTRRAQAISKVVGACRLELDPGGAIVRAGLAFGSVAPTVQRLDGLERWLQGRLPDEQTAAGAEERAREAVQPIDDLRSTADYRRHVAGRLVRAWVLGI